MKETKFPTRALESTFQAIEASFIESAIQSKLEAGCTATVIVLLGNQLIIGNVGDTEAVLYRNGESLLLTELHAATNSKEFQRVKQAGGMINSNKRLCHTKWNPNLVNIAVTRALGDIFFKLEEFTDSKPTGLSAQPFINQQSVLNADEFLVLASDGLWQFMKFQDVYFFIKEKLQTMNKKDSNVLNAVADHLIKEAVCRGSRDHITVIIIHF